MIRQHGNTVLIEAGDERLLAFTKPGTFILAGTPGNRTHVGHGERHIGEKVGRYVEVRRGRDCERLTIGGTP